MRFSDNAAGDSKTEAVRRFYARAPFPGYGARDTLAKLRARGARSEFARLLDQAIPPGARVLDLGCGTGQMALFLAAAGTRDVVAADLTRESLALGAAAARRFGIDRVTFVETDLRRPALRPASFDVVVCTGVLHHTPEPAAAFATVAELARPGGVLVIGLYNAYARIPHRLRRLVARATGFRVFPRDPVLDDRRAEPARREAWLRDQYLHPEEHRHTVGEVQRWFEDNGVQYLRTLPSTLLADAPLEGNALFEPADDDWWLERGLAQLAWMGPLAREGGLFVTVGRKAPI
jgi:2-polyprenyl-3-methyl-5-hydroxy-6-metoxy-1,4-benzoquinol methylase